MWWCSGLWGYRWTARQGIPVFNPLAHNGRIYHKIKPRTTPPPCPPLGFLSLVDFSMLWIIFRYPSQVEVEVEVLSHDGGEFRFRGPNLMVST